MVVTTPNHLARRVREVFREAGVSGLWRGSLEYLEREWVARYVWVNCCRARIKRHADSGDLDRLLELVFNRSWEVLRPFQSRYELRVFLELVRQHKPVRVLEIGTARGGTFFCLSRMAAKDACLISLDLPRGRYGGGYPAWKTPFYRSFARDSQRVHLIQGDSHDPASLQQVGAYLDGQPLDLLFIDGDHTFEGVQRDFTEYSPLVRKGGIIALHDIVPHPPETGCEVHRLWNELKHRYRFQEIVENWEGGTKGIGLLWKN